MSDDLVARIRAICQAGHSAMRLRTQLLRTLSSRVPFDGHVFALADPDSMVLAAPHAVVPMLPRERLSDTIRWRYLTTLNRVDSLVGRPATSLRRSTADPDESLLWQHVLRDAGVVDTAAVTLADRYGVWGFLELWRTGTPFTLDELAVLTASAGVITNGLRLTVANTFTIDPGPTGAPGPAVVVLDTDLRLRNQTEPAVTYLLRLLPPDEENAPIPALAFNAGAALIAKEQGVWEGQPSARAHVGHGHWVTARASRLGDDIAVSIEPSTAPERRDLFGRAIGLSPREREVLGLVAVGLDTSEIAAQLFVSDHTVTSHVKAVLAKAGVRTRAHLTGILSGTSMP